MTKYKTFIKTVARAEKMAGKLYSKYAAKAEKAGCPDEAKAFLALSKSEYGHEKLLKSLLDAPAEPKEPETTSEE